MFLAADKIACLRSLHQKLQNKEIDFGVVDVTWYFAGEHLLIIQSTDFEENSSIVRFILKVDLDFEGYFCGVKYQVASLSENRIFIIDSCSKLQEAINFLSNLTKDSKIMNLLRHIRDMSSITIGKKKYSKETFVKIII